VIERCVLTLSGWKEELVMRLYGLLVLAKNGIVCGKGRQRGHWYRSQMHPHARVTLAEGGLFGSTVGRTGFVLTVNYGSNFHCFFGGKNDPNECRVGVFLASIQ
jgi:hypothetical protein